MHTCARKETQNAIFQECKPEAKYILETFQSYVMVLACIINVMKNLTNKYPSWIYDHCSYTDDLPTLLQTCSMKIYNAAMSITILKPSRSARNTNLFFQYLLQ